jgi:hypothetical protein
MKDFKIWMIYNDMIVANAIVVVREISGKEVTKNEI